MSLNKKGLIILVIVLIIFAFLAVYLLFLSQSSKISKIPNNEVTQPLVQLMADDKSVVLEEKNSDFSTVLKELSSSAKLVGFLNQYFKFVQESSFIGQKPEDFFVARQGNALDFAIFSSFVLKQQGLEGGIIRYDFATEQAGSNFVVVFRDTDLPKYIVATDQGVLMFVHGWSFNDLINAEEERLGKKIGRYAYFPVGETDFSEPVAPYEWIKVE